MYNVLFDIKSRRTLQISATAINYYEKKEHMLPQDKNKIS